MQAFHLGELAHAFQRFLEGAAIVFHHTRTALELIHGQTREGCARTIRRQYVARPGDIIAHRLRTPRAQKRRAGMAYRDLIPGRLGGSIIASHIRIPDAGPVPDMVHYHLVGFQLIYCYSGWVRLVYEDQGPPFILSAGDCVIQPPEIRHRVLESSENLQVVEIGVPAEHLTTIDHEMTLPTPHVRPERMFGGQRFCRSEAAHASWGRWPKVVRPTAFAGIRQKVYYFRIHFLGALPPGL
mgnify:CR=1 FL=1